MAINTVKNWVRAAATEGRRVAKPLGRGPAPRLGTAECGVLRQLVAADNDATLAEYGVRLAAQTGVSVKNSLLATHRVVGAKHLPRYLGAFGASTAALS